ncbi:unnamed protein product [Caretta caretta]
MLHRRLQERGQKVLLTGRHNITHQVCFLEAEQSVLSSSSQAFAMHGNKAPSGNWFKAAVVAGGSALDNSK